MPSRVQRYRLILIDFEGRMFAINMSVSLGLSVSDLLLLLIVSNENAISAETSIKMDSISL